MENQSNSTAKVGKKIKVDSFTFKRKENELIATCIVDDNLSDEGAYEDKAIDFNEFQAFIRREDRVGVSYSIESNIQLICTDLEHFINEKEGRIEEMPDPQFLNPLANAYNHFSLP